MTSSDLFPAEPAPLAITAAALATWIAADPAAILRDLGPVVRLVDGDPLDADPTPGQQSAAALRSLPVVLLANDADAQATRDAADAVLPLDTLDHVLMRIRACPLASIALAVLLRSEAHRDIVTGLLAESATYSLLLAGPEFRDWRARTPAPAATTAPTNDPHRVTTRRGDDTLHITLDRGAKHNAFDRAMRDAVIDALAVAATDPALRVILDGRGPSFCSGGDLDEFGPVTDVATGHAIRLAMSAGRMIAAMSDRVEVRLHGHCLGAGIEFPAFAGRVIAHRYARFGLPELGFGLVPGAGGTVSVPRRIGRQRTMRLALTGEMISAQMALEWGLVDSIVDEFADPVGR